MTGSYFLAPSLVKLYVEEINARWPNRDRASDGWIGDPSHAARSSDHNPDWSAPGARRGVVRAVDIDTDGIDVRALLNEVIGDPRVWYVIYDRVIYSRTYDWRALHYSGSDPHTGHVHLSIMHTETAENDTTQWFGHPKTRGMPAVDLSNVVEAFRAADRDKAANAGVHRIQRQLVEQYGATLKLDGIAGRMTRHAYKLHEKKIDAREIDGVPGRRSLTRLGRGHFRVVA